MDDFAQATYTSVVGGVVELLYEMSCPSIKVFPRRLVCGACLVDHQYPCPREVGSKTPFRPECSAGIFPWSLWIFLK